MDRFFEDWSKELDELEVEVSLAPADLTDAFEQQKSQVGAWAAETRERLGELADHPQAVKTRAWLEELEVQVALGRAETREALDEQRHKLSELMHRATSELNDLQSHGETAWTSWGQSVQDRMAHFQTRLDLLRLHLHLGAAETQEEWESRRQELQQQIRQLRERLDLRAEAEEKWDSVTAEIGEAYQHFRKALKGLFS
ncbi:MAG: hypothetical protein NW241_19035 [Bacteroidia bacterium]|nr:hypothetical protein [Bacteroidia bacterium]